MLFGPITLGKNPRSVWSTEQAAGTDSLSETSTEPQEKRKPINAVNILRLQDFLKSVYIVQGGKLDFSGNT